MQDRRTKVEQIVADPDNPRWTPDDWGLVWEELEDLWQRESATASTQIQCSACEFTACSAGCKHFQKLVGQQPPAAIAGVVERVLQEMESATSGAGRDEYLTIEQSWWRDLIAQLRAALEQTKGEDDATQQRADSRADLERVNRSGGAGGGPDDPLLRDVDQPAPEPEATITPERVAQLTERSRKAWKRTRAALGGKPAPEPKDPITSAPDTPCIDCLEAQCTGCEHERKSPEPEGDHDPCSRDHDTWITNFLPAECRVCGKSYTWTQKTQQENNALNGTCECKHKMLFATLDRPGIPYTITRLIDGDLAPEPEGGELLCPCEDCAGRMEGGQRNRCEIWGGEVPVCEEVEVWVKRVFPRRSAEVAEIAGKIRVWQKDARGTIAATLAGLSGTVELLDDAAGCLESLAPAAPTGDAVAEVKLRETEEQATRFAVELERHRSVISEIRVLFREGQIPTKTWECIEPLLDRVSGAASPPAGEVAEVVRDINTIHAKANQAASSATTPIVRELLATICAASQSLADKLAGSTPTPSTAVDALEHIRDEAACAVDDDEGGRWDGVLRVACEALDKLAGSATPIPEITPEIAERLAKEGTECSEAMAKKMAGMRRGPGYREPAGPSPDAAALAEALAANERDRSKVAEVMSAVLGVIRGYNWATESRGPYHYDDDEFFREFGRCLEAVENAISPLGDIAKDLTSCPTTQGEVDRARRLQPEPAKAPAAGEVWDCIPESCRHSDGWAKITLAFVAPGPGNRVLQWVDARQPMQLCIPVHGPAVWCEACDNPGPCNDPAKMAECNQKWSELLGAERLRAENLSADLETAIEREHLAYKERDEKLETERQAHEETRRAERSVSDAYLRIREIMGAWNTKPGGVDRFEVTEAAVRGLKERLAELEVHHETACRIGDYAHSEATEAALMNQRLAKRISDLCESREMLRKRVAELEARLDARHTCKHSKACGDDGCHPACEDFELPGPPEPPRPHGQKGQTMRGPQPDADREGAPTLGINAPLGRVKGPEPDADRTPRKRADREVLPPEADLDKPGLR